MANPIKRVVVARPDGIMQIMGVIDDPKNFVPKDAGVLVGGQPVALKQAACKQRYYLYVIAPEPETDGA